MVFYQLTFTIDYLHPRISQRMSETLWATCRKDTSQPHVEARHSEAEAEAKGEVHRNYDETRQHSLQLSGGRIARLYSIVCPTGIALYMSWGVFVKRDAQGAINDSQITP